MDDDDDPDLERWRRAERAFGPDLAQCEDCGAIGPAAEADHCLSCAALLCPRCAEERHICPWSVES